MKLTVQSIHFKADQKLVDYIQEKCDKLETFFNNIIEGEAILKVEKDNQHGNKVFELKLIVPNEILLATERGHTFEEATDVGTENMKRQLKKYKEKIRSY